MTGPLGNSEFCFPRISMFPSTSSREILGFSGNKIHCSPRDQFLSVKYTPRAGPLRQLAATSYPTGFYYYEVTRSIEVPPGIPYTETGTPRCL